MYSKVFNIFLLTSLVVAIYGCGSTAQQSNRVAAAKISILPYTKLSCSELASEATFLYRLKDMVEKNVDDEYQSDDKWENIAWIHPFLWMGYDGNQKAATELASIKGQLRAISQVQISKSCRYASYGGGKQRSIAPVYLR